MATTRRPPPLQIFQDPVSSYDHHEIAEADAHFLAAFGPLTDISPNSNTLLNPPHPHIHATSPHKTDRRSSSPPPHALAEASLAGVVLPPPEQHGFTTDSPLKKKSFSPTRSAMPPPPPAAAYNHMFANLPSSLPFDKENMAPAMFADQGLHYPSPMYPVKITPKRTQPDAAPLKSSKKQKTVEPSSDPPVQVPEPENMPAIVDDGSKPGYSYSQLIGLALLHAPQRRLTLAQIYKWISDNFKYYSMADAGWQNSIRHNLSLNKAFIKQDRPKHDPGKGNYWKIVEGQEHTFWNKPQRRTGMPSVTALPPPPPPEASRPSPAPVQPKTVDSSKFPDDTELSSDGTIPCSDPDIHDGQDAGQSMPPPPPRNIRSSPPPAEINSSPPQATASVHDHNDTPLRGPRFTSGNSRSGGRKRKFVGLGDSGYYSSIESSATKAYPLNNLLTSEADHDRPNMKLGRAELEIARIRGSSYDSPSKPAQHKKNKSAPQVPSSPFRTSNERTTERTPLTPPVLFKRPVKPPPSVSPNTNLRNHRKRMRELIGTPNGNFGLLEESPFKPSFELPDPNQFTLYEDHPSFDDAFDVFNDGNYYGTSASPERTHSIKRPRLERAATSTGALADITNSQAESSNRKIDPFWKAMPPKTTPRLGSPLRSFFSPTKQVQKMQQVEAPAARLQSPSKRKDENTPYGMSMSQPLDLAAGTDYSIFADLHSDGSEEGLDILQGFQKIGAPVSVAPNGSPVKQSRPGLGRSTTSLF